MTMLHPSRKPQGCKKTALHCPRKGQPGLCVDCAGEHVSRLTSVTHPSGFGVLSVGPEKLSQAGTSGFLHNLIGSYSNLLKRIVVGVPPRTTARPGRENGSSPAIPFRSLVIIVCSSVVSVLHRSFLSGFFNVCRKTEGTTEGNQGVGNERQELGKFVQGKGGTACV